MSNTELNPSIILIDLHGEEDYFESQKPDGSGERERFKIEDIKPLFEDFTKKQKIRTKLLFISSCHSSLMGAEFN